MARFAWMEAPEKIPEEKITTRKEADIVIVGAGQAGTCAARAAAEAGASVIVIEQQDEENWDSYNNHPICGLSGCFTVE